jgi:AcrR family transcriptional regulator
MAGMKDATDPRAVRSRVAMLRAAHDILRREGPTAVTHQRVAEQAGVGRATVYRHWPRPEQLLLEAMSGVEMPFFRVPAVPVRSWLREQLYELGAQLRMPEVVATAGTLMQGSLWDKGIAERRDALVATLAGQLQPGLDLAMAIGELQTTLDAYDASALMVGPVLYRTTMQDGELSAVMVDHLLDSLGTWHHGDSDE